MGFREQTEKMKDDLLTRTQESIDRNEESVEYGSVFIKDKIPEGMGFWRPDVGEHLIDVVPFITGENHPRDPAGRLAYVVDFWAHRNIGPGNDPFACLFRNWKKRDPICDYIKENRVPTDEWKKIAPKRRTAYLVWVHDTPEEEEKGLQIWEVAHWFFEKNVTEISINPKGGAPVAFSHPDHGRSIAFSIKKSGTFIDSTGKERDSKDYVGHRFYERDEALPDEVLDQSFALDECINMHPDYEVMKNAFMGIGADEGEETPPETAKEPDSQQQLDDNIPEQEEPAQEEEPERKDEDRAMPADDGELSCPAGGTMGVDIDKLPECKKCDVWDPCSDKADAMSKGGATPEKKKLITRKTEEPEPKKQITRRTLRRRT